jgi:hypothetical protein
MDEACLSGLLACTVHVMHCRNVKHHVVNFYLLKCTGETVIQTEKDVPCNTIIYFLDLPQFNLQFLGLLFNFY